MIASNLRTHARAIWDAALNAVRADVLVREALTDSNTPLNRALEKAGRILVVGGGKAGSAMSEGFEAAFANRLKQVTGIVNVPSEALRTLQAVCLHGVRPTGSNEPTAAGVEGTRQILDLVSTAGPDDVVVALISGGGSALLPAPVAGVTLEDKQAVTRLLSECGATIGEMNAVRKHLSRIKGGGLARACTSGQLWSLIISDVVGDPLDVIASGPTAPDPTTFADALGILQRFRLHDRVPASVRNHLERGVAGLLPETLKEMPSHVHNVVLGNNARALKAAASKAQVLGYRVLNLGSFIEGETQQVALALAGIVRSIVADAQPLPPPACILIGGETTVTLPPDHGKGGRNMEFVLAALVELCKASPIHCAVLSGGTDGEDGPTDAAGACADPDLLEVAAQRGLEPRSYLQRHDSYTFFDAVHGLVRTGLTLTNVMDVRVILVDR